MTYTRCAMSVWCWSRSTCFWTACTVLLFVCSELRSVLTLWCK